MLHDKTFDNLTPEEREAKRHKWEAVRGCHGQCVDAEPQGEPTKPLSIPQPGDEFEWLETNEMFRVIRADQWSIYGTGLPEKQIDEPEHGWRFNPDGLIKPIGAWAERIAKEKAEAARPEFADAMPSDESLRAQDPHRLCNSEFAMMGGKVLLHCCLQADHAGSHRCRTGWQWSREEGQAKPYASVTPDASDELLRVFNHGCAQYIEAQPNGVVVGKRAKIAGLRAVFEMGMRVALESGNVASAAEHSRNVTSALRAMGIDSLS